MSPRALTCGSVVPLISRDQPALLQVCLIFTAGMGWEKIVATAVGK